MSKIKISQNAFEPLIAKLNKNSTYLSDLKNGVNESDCELIEISKLKNNFVTISDRMSQLSNTCNKGFDCYCEGEIQNNASINEIPIPTELKTVYSPYNTDNNNISLSKNDSNAIKKDQDLESKNLDELDDIDEEEKLADIFNKEVLEEKELKSNYVNNIQTIYNQNNNETELVQAEDIDEVENIGLGNIDNENNTEETDYDSSSTIQSNERLKSVNNTVDLDQINYEDNLNNLNIQKNDFKTPNESYEETNKEVLDDEDKDENEEKKQEPQVGDKYEYRS